MKTVAVTIACVRRLVAYGAGTALLVAATGSMRAQTVDAFDPNANSTVRSIAVLTNGQIFIGGTFTNVSGTTRNRAALLNSSGTLVNGFNPNANERILASVVQADGKIVIGGGFTTIGGVSRTHLARLNTDGSLDTTFTNVANNWVWALAPQADGKILVGGLFTQLGGQTRNFMARLNANGSLDTGFNPGADAQVNSIVEQPDTKIVVGGFFTNLAGQVRQHIGRLNANGTIDAAFNPGADAAVWKLALQANGQIVVGGFFTNLGGQFRNNLGRLNGGGSIDAGFNPGASSTVNSLVVQSDGKIVAGGNFTNIAGQSRTYLARLNTNGTLDSGFTSVANNTLYNLALQPDGKILVGGDFTSLGGQPRNRMGRLSPASLAITAQPQSQKVLFGSPATFTVAASGAAPIFYQWRKDGVVVQTATNASFTIATVQAANVGNYSVVVSNAAGSVTSAGAALKALKVLNDDFDSAYVISGLPASVAGHNIGATAEPGEPKHSAFAAGKSVWWQWTAPFTAAVTVDTFGSSFTPVIAVYTGNSFATLSGVASNAFGENASFLAAAGTIYHIAVDGNEGGNDSGTIVLNLRAPPANDAFANSFVITGMVSFVVGHNVGATAQAGEPSHYEPELGGGFPAARSVWWSWTAPSNTMVSLDTTGSSFATVLAVYTGTSVSSLSLVSSNFYQRFGGQGGRSRLNFPATAGQTYRIVIDGAFEEGVIALHLRAGTAAGNDAFANRFVIPQGTSSVSGSNVDASKEGGEPDHANGEGARSLWWTWTSPTNGTVRLDTAGSSVATDLAVYTGTAVSSLTEIASDHDFPESEVVFNVSAGVTYQIVLDSIDSGVLVLNFRSAPSNDAFASAIALIGTTVSSSGNNRGASKQPGEGSHAGDAGGRSVWWRWTAPNSGSYVLDTIGSSFDTLLAVYVGDSVSGPALVASNDNTGSSTVSRVIFSAVAGTVYRIVIDGKGGVSGDLQLNLHPNPALPPNDAFANARTVTSFPSTISGWNLGATTEFDEPPFEATASVWWVFAAPGDGTVTIDKLSGSPSLRFTVFRGNSLSALTEVAHSTDFNSFPFKILCSTAFPVQPGTVYYVAVDSAAGNESYFDFGISFAPRPPNDAFANRISIPSAPASLFGSTVGATTETNEPAEGARGSIWWTWTPAISGPIVITTAGSSFDTVLAVYTGNTLATLSLVAWNDDALIIPTITAPPSDPISRVKFTATAGTPYHILVASGPGSVTLNLEPLAIDEIVSMTPSSQPDRSTDFSASLRLSNFRMTPSNPLRLRLLARAGYSYVQLLANNCGQKLPAQDVPDQELGVVDLSPSATLGAGASILVSVNGRCPPPFERGDWGYGWGVLAILEEELAGIWTAQDSRLLLVGGWPRVNGFIGPGGGVVTIQSGTGAVGPAPGLVRVQLGPPSALRLGGQWRVSPTNFGSVALRTYTNYTNVSIVLQAPTNGFTIEVKELPGFIVPSNQTLTVIPSSTAQLNLNYLVVPPRLFFHRSLGLGMTGTTATAYQIDRVSSLSPPINWSSNTAVTLTPGTNWIPGTAPIITTNRFYRARWLPD